MRLTYGVYDVSYRCDVSSTLDIIALYAISCYIGLYQDLILWQRDHHRIPEHAAKVKVRLSGTVPEACAWGQLYLTKWQRPWHNTQVFWMMENCTFWFEFQWRLFLRAKFTINQQWFSQWPYTKQVTSHYLKKWSPAHQLYIYIYLGHNESTVFKLNATLLEITSVTCYQQIII